jgi:1,4-alpha-glucan branching enzyme
MKLPQYQWERFIGNNKPKKEISKLNLEFGPRVIKRDGNVLNVRFQLLIDNPDIQAYLVGPFNEWGKKGSVLGKFELKHDKHSVFAYVETNAIKHKDPYKFMIRYGDKEWFYIQDPAGFYFDNQGNTIFWDYEDSSAYKQKYGFINTIDRPTKILQTDLPGLVAHWKHKKTKKLGQDVAKDEYYRFIADSGVLEHIKSLGFNTIQFLPFAQSIDGDNWKYRYLVPFQYAVQNLWGNPDDFAYMIDKAHALDIAIIGDFVLGHMPYKDFRIFGQGCEFHGIHHWVNRHGYMLYLKEETSWGTMRIDFDNPYVRDFMVQSVLSFMKHYKIDGIRVDNVDGIIRYGANGDGEERPNGRNFLRQMNSTIYQYNPYELIHFESHYFYKDNAKMLVVPFELDKRALGATAYNSSRLTYFFHKDFMLKDIKDISIWKFKDITDEKEWGQSNSTIADFHNHDAAAGLMEMRATGSYAYDAMLALNPNNHIHALGKIKVMEAIISFLAEGRTLDLVQTFLLQTGTFEHDSSIKWYLTFNQVSRNTLEYKKKINKIMDDEAFWPVNTKNRQFLNIDDKNKILVIERSSEKSRYVIVINLGAWKHYNYKVGIKQGEAYSVELNSDLFDYAGFGLVGLPDKFKVKPSKNFEFLDKEIELPMLAPYHVIVLKRSKTF